MAKKKAAPSKPPSNITVSDRPTTRAKRDAVDESLIIEGKRVRKTSQQAVPVLVPVVTAQQRLLTTIEEETPLDLLDGIYGDSVPSQRVNDGFRSDHDYHPDSPVMIEDSSASENLYKEKPATELSVTSGESSSETHMSLTSVKGKGKGLAKRKAVVKNKKGVVEKKDELMIEILRFRVPYKNKDGQTVFGWLELDYNSTTLEQAKARIYTTIKCDDVEEIHLPSLTCHFSHHKKGEDYPIEDWNFIKKAWVTELKKKKSEAMIEINLPDNFLNALYINLKVQQKQGGSLKSKPKAAPIKNLFATDDSTIGAVTEERTPTYAKWEQQLIQELSKCKIHTEIFCKIDKNNEHRQVSDQQLRVWTEALAIQVDPSCNREDVSVTKPPKLAIFEPWRTDLKSIQPPIPHRKDRHTGSEPPLSSQNNQPGSAPNIIILNRHAMKMWGHDSHQRSSSPDYGSRKRRHSSSSHANEDIESEPLLIEAWLEKISLRPDAKYVDMWGIQHKLSDPKVDMMDVPLSFLANLSADDMIKNIGLSMKECGFISTCLKESKQRKKGRRL